MSYADLSAELAGKLPGLSGYLADDFIKRAWRHIRDARLWSFLISDGAVICPVARTAGTYQITQYATTVTANAAASAAFLSLPLAQVPATAMQIRFMGPGQTSQVYRIVALNQSVPSAIVLTLDRPIVEVTSGASQYLCYRAYVAAPGPDFSRWLSFVDMVNGHDLWTDGKSWTVDAYDPQRQALGQAYRLASFQYSTTPTLPMYELWPGPTSGQSFYVRYRRRGLDFSAPDDVQPDVIPDALIMETALALHAYPFAMANQGRFPAMQKVNWANLIQLAKRNVYGDRSIGYCGMLQDAKRADDNTMNQSIINPGHGLRNRIPYPWPIDANFLSTHLVPF